MLGELWILSPSNKCDVVGLPKHLYSADAAIEFSGNAELAGLGIEDAKA
jgi:hypothetical protein